MGKMVLHATEIKLPSKRGRMSSDHVKLHFNAAAKLSKSIHENKLESIMMLIYQNIGMRWHRPRMMAFDMMCVRSQVMPYCHTNRGERIDRHLRSLK